VPEQTYAVSVFHFLHK